MIGAMAYISGHSGLSFSTYFLFVNLISVTWNYKTKIIQPWQTPNISLESALSYYLLDYLFATLIATASVVFENVRRSINCHDGSERYHWTEWTFIITCATFSSLLWFLSHQYLKLRYYNHYNSPEKISNGIIGYGSVVFKSLLLSINFHCFYYLPFAFFDWCFWYLKLQD